ncbi:hypothetical protein OF846_004932 [Rhodotorula toruloides]|nr:hypothetical protein OF846_004932 [Rhodotorula toruloides]
MPDLAHFDPSSVDSSPSRSRPVPRPLDLASVKRLDGSTGSPLSGEMSALAADSAGEVDLRARVAEESLGEVDVGVREPAEGEEERQELKQSQRQTGTSGAARPPPLDLQQPSTSTSHLSARSLPPSTAPSPQLSRSVLGYTSSTRSTTGSPYRRRATTSGLSSGRRSEPVAPLALNGSGPSSAAQPPAGASSRFLLTVVPPGHLPHDPPHPRSNPSASGYGPPEHFRRGTLVPLYPTLSSQLAAIAREYGLPSSGGLVLYLLSTTDPSTQQPFPQASGFAGEGGPRISETAWSMLWAQLFAEEEAEREMAFLRQQEAEMGYSDEEGEADYSDVPPPVPPIPVQHDQQALPRQRQTSESDNAILSDENEPVSQSSDAGASGDGSVYSAATGAAEGSVKDKQNASASRPSSLAQAGLGRGLPSALTSPNARFSKRFTSLPPNLPPRHQRHSSRHSVRSASNAPRNHRSSSYMYSAPPHSAGGLRSASYASSHFAPPLFSAGPSLPSYGASVVVGKIEFDIHASTRQGKWYEAWLASAAPTPVIPTVPASREMEAGKAPETEKAWQELQLPNLVAAKTPQQPEARGLGVDQGSAIPSPHARSVDEQTTPSSRTRLLTTSTGGFVSPIVQSQNLESAESSFSLAGLAGHSPEPSPRTEREAVDDETDRTVEDLEKTPLIDSRDLQPLRHDEAAPPTEAALVDSSIVDKDDIVGPERPTYSRSPSSLPSRPASNASTQLDSSERGTDDTPLLEQEAEHAGYQALDDDEPPKAEDADSDSDDSRYGVQTTESEQLDQQASGVKDPLGDVFGSDEATWRSIAADDTVPRCDEREVIETTGLGFTGSQNLATLDDAPPGIVERRPDDESLDERGLPPPQDDVADVQAMLSPSTPTAPTHPAYLASPIRLDGKSESAADVSRDAVQEAVAPAASSSSGEERAQTSPFLASHSSKTSISTINFTVRPPSTTASMSPEFVPQRKQRHGWTNIPPVVDPSMSASSSLSSIAPLAEEEGDVSEGSSAVGLERNLDDLERALAELSPRALPTSRMPHSPSTVLAQADEPQAGPSLLASRRAFRYGAPASPDLGSSPRFDFEQAESPARQLDFAPVPAPGLPDEPRAETLAAPPAERPRIPRSSSLHKPAGHPQPHLVALPPSPLPETIAAFASPSPEPEEAPVPTLPSASPSWPAPPPLPLSPEPAPVPPTSFADIVPPPPPAKEETPAPQPRSPGPLKSLRNGKWGSRSKSIDAGKAGSPADASEESSGSKSPLGSFFGKFGRSKSRKSDPTSPEPPLPIQPFDAAIPPTGPEPAQAEHVQPSPHPPRKQSLDVARPRRPSVSGSLPRDFAADEPLPPFPPSLAASVTTAPQLPPFSPSEETTLDSWNAAAVGEASPVGTPLEAQPLFSGTRFEGHEQPAAPLSQNAVQGSAALPPVEGAASSDFSALAFPAGILPPAAPATPRSPPTASSSANDSPATGEVVSPSAFPQPPTTPRYPASAPVTPAGWPLATPRTRSGGKRRLSADIDQLLSQMNDIEFGLGDDDDAAKAHPAVPAVPLPSAPVPPMPVQAVVADEATAPELAASPAPYLVEPDASLAYVGESTSPTTPPIALPSFDAHDATASSGGGLLGVQQSLDRPLSEDLRALGSMMTGMVASPPTSPPSKTTGLTSSDSAYLDYIVASSPPATNAALASA